MQMRSKAITIARLALQMVMDNHDPAIGINQKVLGKYIKQVVKMKRDGII
jgi:hypothetical protein